MSNASLRLNLQQRQTLHMTPQLQQSLKMLQYSTQELSDYLEEALEQNPLLEATEEDHESHTAEPLDPADHEGEPTSQEPSKSQDVLEATEHASLEHQPSEVLDMEDPIEEGLSSPASHKEDGLSMQHMQPKHHAYDGPEDMMQNLSGTITLKEHLYNQVEADCTNPSLRFVLYALVDALDENGYLTTENTVLAKQLGSDITLIEEAKSFLHGCDPAGVGAANLQECLRLQLEDRNHLDPAMERLLRHLDLVAKRETKKLAKICQVEEEDILDMCQELRLLNPKPGSLFAEDIAQQVLPDMLVQQTKEGHWVVELDTSRLPRVLLNNRYIAYVKNQARTSQEKDYIVQQHQEATWLVRSLQQRANTILQVVTELVAQQQAFLERGIHFLKPLTFKDIAQKVEMHESTVGRAVAGKYVATPRGTYPLKYFFSSGIGHHSGEECSSKTVQHIIGELVEAEPPTQILSDEKIATLLQERGMHIARRTVAKYREQLGIPSSAARKRQKRAAL